MKQPTLALHIFRRDLRLHDNTALIEALSSADHVAPLFIFDPRQIEKNEYKSDHTLQFMAHSINELRDQLQKKNAKLYLYYGIAEDIIQTLIIENPIHAVYLNRDYTPFSRARDAAIAARCKSHQVEFHCYADALLHEPEQTLKSNGSPYTIFTPAFNRAKQLVVAPPAKNNGTNYYQATLKGPNEQPAVLDKLLRLSNPNLIVKGGRLEGIRLLKKIGTLTSYQQQRDIPAFDGTTHLSAHHKFGTVSPRETYAQVVSHFGQQHTLINELHWRDFFTHIGFHFPHVFSGAFHPRYDAITWSTNQTHFRAWQEGRTGFPLVDAGMRELNTTGYMHNRVRMVVASFLTKDLHIDWRWGEQYFAQQLVDYDPAVNNGNWQWAASTGCDAQPYFRIFNPWLQQKKFDPECLYIKRWIPELARIPNKTIHALFKTTEVLMTNYPHPIVDHAVESQKAKLMYKHL